MTDPSQTAQPDTARADAGGEADEPRRLARSFGPLTWPRVLVLGLALAFLGGAIGYLIGHRGDRDPLSSTDVGFMQDMSAHHEQAVQMSIILLGKDDVDRELHAFAMEIILGQRYEMGIMNATLDRFGHTSEQGPTAMAWMGEPVAAAEMPGLATDEQMDQLREAQGEDAEALWIALMSEHHLGGMHMADYEVRHGQDRTVRNVAEEMLKTQRGEVLDLDRTRKRLGLPIPEGFDDPTQSPEMRPLSAAHDD